MPAFVQRSRFENCEVRYGLNPVLPSVTSTPDCAGADMYERNANAAAFVLASFAALTAPDHPPKAAKGEWFTPLIAFGQVVASQATSLPVFRSSTCFEPSRFLSPRIRIISRR